MDIRVAHSEALDRGGALFVAEELARIFSCNLHLGFELAGVVADDVGTTELFDSSIARRVSSESTTARDLYFAVAWQHVPELHDADVVFESGNNPGWYVPRDTQAVVRYVHSTPYAAYHRFLQTGNTLVGKLYGTALRTLYAQTIPFPDIWVANSELVARRVQRYWGVDDVEVVYPPVDVDSYEPREQEDYYLTFSHLRAEKRIDEIVRAFDGLNKQLVVGGDGPEKHRLEEIAPDNVEFVGYLDEQEKRRRLGEAQAFIFNAHAEDFGIVPIESFASGTPVIGVREGYTQYQINHGKNGILYDRGIPELRDVIKRFEPEKIGWSREEIIEEARQYSVERFQAEISEIAQRAYEKTKIKAD
ncbi:Glycosyltransferase involved in cell wall bisynthesis [Halogranum gelatinilyticum]|uniref:Glycosyltransferase involved in cell wall bisynthesis n=1 Tax=Halogranum gelatinilyticum TaxID=660521 RepID=A0A1G9X5H1_9EURY|nr:glycosyltransferase [Halogranum gelatinilyticum]SDM92010.1 Glycosyltransferase involved in cell wall bisynthesis [Halogranum gelatinilyticum]